MHRNDRPCPWRNRGFDQSFIEIERVFTDVDKDRNRAAQDESVCGRDECLGSQNDLVAALEIQQQRGQIQCG